MLCRCIIKANPLASFQTDGMVAFNPLEILELLGEPGFESICEGLLTLLLLWSEYKGDPREQASSGRGEMANYTFPMHKSLCGILNEAWFGDQGDILVVELAALIFRECLWLPLLPPTWPSARVPIILLFPDSRPLLRGSQFLISLLSVLLPRVLMAAGEEGILAATLVLLDFTHDLPSLSGQEHAQTHTCMLRHRHM